MSAGLHELPAGLIGNGSLLATISPSGRMERLCWPNVDWAQHLGELRLGVVRDGVTVWLHENGLEHAQRYLDGTAAFETTSRSEGVAVQVLDFAVPDRPVLVRRVRSERDDLRLVVYCRPELSERRRYGGAFVDRSRGAVVYYCRTHALALSLGTGAEAACGRIRPGDAESPLYEAAGLGEVRGRAAAHGVVDGALAQDLGRETTLVAAFATTPERALVELDAAAAAGAGELLRRRGSHDEERAVVAHPPLDGPQGLPALYRRSISVFDLLADRETGGVIAAPELDPDFVHSGGYGFVWARDLTYVILAFLASGRRDLAASSARWLGRSQSPDGSWAQRHWTNGRVAPSWCPHQLDETGSALFALEAVWRELRDEELDRELWPVASAAAEFLLAFRDPETGLVRPSFDLWEEREAVHAYTVAATVAGLRSAAAFAARHEPDRALSYATAAQELRDALEREFWSEPAGRFVRSPGDETVDVSLLGLAWPFVAVDPGGERMRATASAVATHLRRDGGLLRYEGDRYAGGNAWVLAALWLGLWCRQVGDGEGLEEAIRYAIECQTMHGLLAEQVDSRKRPVWVLPLAWSHAMLVLAARPEQPVIETALEYVEAAPAS